MSVEKRSFYWIAEWSDSCVWVHVLIFHKHKLQLNKVMLSSDYQLNPPVTPPKITTPTSDSTHNSYTYCNSTHTSHIYCNSTHTHHCLHPANCPVLTCFFCPSLHTRAIAWSSLAGFQSGSNITNRLAPIRLRPHPPALLLSMKIKSELYKAIQDDTS